MHEALHLKAASTTAVPMTSDQSLVMPVVERKSSKYCWLKVAPSASRAILAMMETASVGYSPLAVSPDNMTQSAPSKRVLLIDTSLKLN